MNSINDYFGSIYKWMAVGVAISAVVAYLVPSTPLAVIYTNSWYFYGVVGIELALVFGIQFMINKLSAIWAYILFFVYAALNGLTIAGIIWHYVAQSPTMVVAVFASAVFMFAFLALYGYNTKSNYAGWGTFLYAGVIGVLVSSVINIFFQSSMMHMVITWIALGIFSALTVYDVQSYKAMYGQLSNEEEKKKMSILGALHMYINLIVMFQSLLQIVGGFSQD